jgi:hypothetical protein
MVLIFSKRLERLLEQLAATDRLAGDTDDVVRDRVRVAC